MLLLFRALGTAAKALPILFCFAYSLTTSERNSDFVVCDLHHGISIRRRIHCLRVQNSLWMRQQTSVQTLMEQTIAFLFIQGIILLNLHTCFVSIILVVDKWGLSLECSFYFTAKAWFKTCVNFYIKTNLFLSFWSFTFLARLDGWTVLVELLIS